MHEELFLMQWKVCNTYRISMFWSPVSVITLANYCDDVAILQRALHPFVIFHMSIVFKESALYPLATL